MAGIRRRRAASGDRRVSARPARRAGWRGPGVVLGRDGGGGVHGRVPPARRPPRSRRPSTRSGLAVRGGTTPRGRQGVVVTSDRAGRARARRALHVVGGRVVESSLDGPGGLGLRSAVSVRQTDDGVRLAAGAGLQADLDGGRGNRTWRHGLITPMTWAQDDLAEAVLLQVVRPTLAEMADRGTPFVRVPVRRPGADRERPPGHRSSTCGSATRTSSRCSRCSSPLGGC